MPVYFTETQTITAKNYQQIQENICKAMLRLFQNCYFKLMDNICIPLDLMIIL